MTMGENGVAKKGPNRMNTEARNWYKWKEVNYLYLNIESCKRKHMEFPIDKHLWNIPQGEFSEVTRPNGRHQRCTRVNILGVPWSPSPRGDGCEWDQNHRARHALVHGDPIGAESGGAYRQPDWLFLASSSVQCCIDAASLGRPSRFFVSAKCTTIWNLVSLFY